MRWRAALAFGRAVVIVAHNGGVSDSIAQRFWIPPTSALTLADAGFLPDPEEDFARAYNPDVVDFAAIACHRCLILIGEPGMGKTTALQTERSAVQAPPAAGPHLVSGVDLGSTRSEEVLNRKIFESDAYQRYRAGEGELHLFLDSLDEARIRIETVADLLLDGLDGADFARLHLRVACRTADRHHGLEQELRRRFGEDAFAVYEVVPLRRRDIADACRDRGLDEERFVRAVVRRNLQPLAIKPITLRLLLSTASQEEGLPDGQSELYVRGCRLLCEEPDEDRRRGAPAGKLTTGQRFALAARLAAATILTGRASVVTDGASELVSVDEVSVDELAGGREREQGTAIGDTFAVDTEAVREVLATGLFSARGAHRLGWAHQTYGEFLAAFYLQSTGAREAQVLDLLTVREHGRARVVPQLSEVATWLSVVAPKVFQALLPGDPAVVLRGDLALADEEQRRVLVDALLVGVGDGSIDRWDARIHHNLGQLGHSELAGQLRTVLRDDKALPRARQVAADVAGACAVEELEHDLTGLALDDNHPSPLRQAGVTALGDYARLDVRRHLLPLATQPLSNDPDDELKGAALRATWPELLSAAELFDALSPPKRDNLYGLYKSFLLNQVIPGLDDDDLAIALRWIAVLPRQHHATDALSGLAEQIMVRAWDSLHRPDVLEPYVDVVASFLTGNFALLSHDERNKGNVFVEPHGRRRLLELLSSRVGDGQFEAGFLVLSTPPLLHAGDLSWLLERLEAAIGTPLERGWAALVEALFGLARVDPDPLMEVRERSSFLHELTASAFDPVRLESEEAERSRETWRKWQRLRRLDEEEAAEAPDMAARINADLDRFESGDLNGFWHLNLDLSVEQGRRRYGSSLLSDLRRYPGWESADADTRTRILRAAEDYLLRGEPQPDEWFGTNRVWEPAWSGYRALRLIAELESERLIVLDKAPWQRWASIIVGWPRDGGDEGEFNDWAMLEAFRHAPAEVLRWFGQALDAELEEGKAYVIHRVRGIWDSRIEALVLERARREDVVADARTALIEVLLEHRSAPGRVLAEELLAPDRLSVTAPQGELAVQVAQLLVELAADAGWPLLWPLVEANARFGREVFEAVAMERESSVVDRLSEQELGDLFLWLEGQYPHATDPDLSDGVGFMGPREQVGFWRDGALRGLVAKSTPEAVEQLQRLEEALPHLAFLRAYRREAEELVRRTRWTPPRPADIVRMGADANRRWVTSDGELREVVGESLKRADEALQAPTPAATDLWDTTAKRPKSENELSDWLKRWLDADLRGRGVVVGREVQVRPGPGGKMGESTDLLVEAIAGERVEGAERVSVSIEVKGCWHPKVDEAMETQLAERYLRNEGRCQGVYIVGWFAAGDWNESDRRRRACARRDLSESRRFFAEQARDVSSRHELQIDAFVLDATLSTRAAPASAATPRTVPTESL